MFQASLPNIRPFTTAMNRSIDRVKVARRDMARVAHQEVGMGIIQGHGGDSKGTPVDEGSARANWTASMGPSPSPRSYDRRGPSNVIGKRQAALEAFTTLSGIDYEKADVFWWSNASAPYIQMLDKGRMLSRNPPRHDAQRKAIAVKIKQRIARGKPPPVIITGGYSPDAPRGIVGVAIARVMATAMPRLLQRLVRQISKTR